MASHILHQELFFIPIVLASFWFRLPWGIGVAVIVSLVYSLIVYVGQNKLDSQVTLYLQIFLYIGVAAMIGWLTGRLQEQQRLMLRNERHASLARLASALSFEIRDIVNILNMQYEKLGGFSGKGEDVDFKNEIDRLANNKGQTTFSVIHSLFREYENSQ